LVKRNLFLPQQRPSAADTHFPLEALKAAYEFLAAGIDSDVVMFVERKRNQKAHFQFCKSSALIELSLPGNTTLKLWQLLKGNYDRTRFIPTAYLCEGYVFVVLLDTSKFFINRG
jgi:hypothetical protein